MKSELFRLNQVGYTAGLPVHIAVLTGEPLVLKDGSGKVIPCPVPAPREDRASGDSVCVVNLGVLPEGSYTLSAGGETRRLTVSARPWTEITTSAAAAALPKSAPGFTPIRPATPRKRRTGKTVPSSGRFRAAGMTRETTGNTSFPAPSPPRTSCMPASSFQAVVPAS